MAKQLQQQLLAVLTADTTLCDLLKQKQHQPYFSNETNPVKVWAFVVKVFCAGEDSLNSSPHRNLRLIL